MKNRFFYAAFLFAFVLTGIFSCSNDDDTPSATPPAAFFNYNVGNKWVYKRYENTNDNPNNFTFSGITDSVRVEAIVNINGLLFSKLSHKKTGQAVYHEFLRTNNAGHLVGFTDLIYFDGNYSSINENNPSEVMHPGLDTAYEATASSPWGLLHYHLAAQANITVEGNDYAVSPYLGDYTPNDPQFDNKTVEFNYKPRVGLVKQVCHSTVTNFSWEDRLVSYHLN